MISNCPLIEILRNELPSEFLRVLLTWSINQTFFQVTNTYCWLIEKLSSINSVITMELNIRRITGNLLLYKLKTQDYVCKISRKVSRHKL